MKKNILYIMLSLFTILVLVGCVHNEKLKYDYLEVDRITFNWEVAGEKKLEELSQTQVKNFISSLSKVKFSSYPDSVIISRKDDLIFTIYFLDNTSVQIMQNKVIIKSETGQTKTRLIECSKNDFTKLFDDYSNYLNAIIETFD